MLMVVHCFQKNPPLPRASDEKREEMTKIGEKLNNSLLTSEQTKEEVWEKAKVQRRKEEANSF